MVGETDNERSVLLCNANRVNQILRTPRCRDPYDDVVFIDQRTVHRNDMSIGRCVGIKPEPHKSILRIVRGGPGRTDAEEEQALTADQRVGRLHEFRLLQETLRILQRLHVVRGDFLLHRLERVRFFQLSMHMFAGAHQFLRE